MATFLHLSGQMFTLRIKTVLGERYGFAWRNMYTLRLCRAPLSEMSQ
jgi:hypothetical protein